MRNPISVACGILELIPDEQTEFISDIQMYVTDLKFVAPEVLGKDPKHWHKFGQILNKYISQDDYDNTEWCKGVINIFTDPNYAVV